MRIYVAGIAGFYITKNHLTHMTLARTPMLLLTGIIMSAILLSSCATKQDGVESKRAVPSATARTNVDASQSAYWEYRTTKFASMPIPWRFRTVRDSVIVQIYNLDKAVDPGPILSQIQTDMRWNYRRRPIKEAAGDIAFQNAVLKVHATLYSNGQFVETALY
ncbi:MAG: hypothetical protein HGB34_03995 [Candidatus Moranbacteria bacterium]|nr:hypothetical protein [Candidatus Moranbacteria bacterium]